jgi:hypothetical protein
MPTPRKSRPQAAPAPAPVPETKAAEAFRRFKEAAAAAAASAPSKAPAPAPAQAPPSFSLPPGFAQGWAVLPQPGPVPPGPDQPGPQAMYPLGDRLGTTLRLGIDVINMALAGSLRMLGGAGYGGHERDCGCPCGCGGHARQESCCGGHDCCEVFERDCCTPSVGSCCH